MKKSIEVEDGIHMEIKGIQSSVTGRKEKKIVQNRVVSYRDYRVHSCPRSTRSSGDASSKILVKPKGVYFFWVEYIFFPYFSDLRK